MSEHAYTAARVQAGRQAARSAGGAAAAALAVAAGCAIALPLLWLIAELVRAAQLKDAALLYHFTLLSRPGPDQVGSFLLHLLNPLPFIFWGIALVALALAQGRPRVAVAVAAVMAFASWTTETLKPLAAHAHLRAGEVHIGPASWPSGHSTAALALALCAVLVAPRPLRPIVAVIGGVFALAVGCFLLILAWHMPSDVLAGYLVASLWMALAVAALRGAELRWPTRPRRLAAPSA